MIDCKCSDRLVGGMHDWSKFAAIDAAK